MIIIISSPSGTGKTTICNMLVKKIKNMCLSVSVTTRKKRIHEIEGKDYFFKKKEEFLRLKSKNKFLETASIFANYYGTLKDEVLQKLKNGNDVIIDIDWQGTRQIDKHMKSDVVKIFLLPPSLNELTRRLSERGSESAEEINLRMSNAVKEIKHYKEYDYVLVNDNLEKTFRKIKRIIRAEKMKLSRQNLIKKFVLNLLKD